MPSLLPSSTAARLLALAFLAPLSASLVTASAAPVVAKATASAPVTVKDTARISF